jgi:hypothetical protein
MLVLLVFYYAIGARNCCTSSITSTVGSRFMTGLCSRIFGCKSNRRKTSTI